MIGHIIAVGAYGLAVLLIAYGLLCDLVRWATRHDDKRTFTQEEARARSERLGPDLRR